MAQYTRFEAPDEIRPIGTYAAYVDGQHYADFVRRSNVTGHTVIERYPARHVSLKSIDLGFDPITNEIVLPDRVHIVVDTDHGSYAGWYRDVAAKMTDDGWTIISQ